MKAVGIKILKNNLSKYLDMVRSGETLMVLDRDEIIAEIHQPTHLTQPLDPLTLILEQETRQGLVKGSRENNKNAARVASNQKEVSPVIPDDVLDFTREDRF